MTTFRGHPTTTRLVTLALIGTLLFHSQSWFVARVQAAVTVLSSASDGGDDLFFTTTSAIDTTGATLLVVCASSLNAVTMSDSQSNTWTGLTAQQTASSGRSQVFYVINPSVSATHTFTATASYPALGVLALVGTDDTTTFDQQNGNAIENSASTSIQPGSVTPSEANEIVVACLNYSFAGTIGIDAPFSPPLHDIAIGGSNYGMTIAYEIQGAATARNPTWTHGGGGAYLATTIATFTVAGAAAPAARPCCLGVF